MGIKKKTEQPTQEVPAEKVQEVHYHSTTGEPLAQRSQDKLNRQREAPIQEKSPSGEELKAPSIDEPINPDIDGSHILDLIGGDPLEDGADEEAPLAGHNKNLPKEEWCKLLAGAIKMGGHMSSFETLKAVDYANPEASEGLGAMYDTIEDIPSLHWLLKPFGKWAMRIIAISAFVLPLVKGCAGEIKQKKAIKAQGAGQKINPTQQEQEEAFVVPVVNMNA